MLSLSKHREGFVSSLLTAAYEWRAQPSNAVAAAAASCSATNDAVEYWGRLVCV